LKILLFPVLFV